MRIVILFLLVAGIFLHAVGSWRWAMPANERLLQQRAVADLRSDDRFSNVSVEYELLDGRAGGQVPSAEAREQAFAAIRNASPAGRVFDHLEVVPPRDQPALVVLDGSDAGAIRMTGQVGHSTIKASLKESLTGLNPKREVVDEIAVSERVREPKWAVTAGALASQFFQKVPAGRLELQEGQFVVSGRIKGEKALEAVLAEVRPFLPEEAKLVSKLDLAPDQPAALSAKRDGKKLLLSGKLPSSVDTGAWAEAIHLPGMTVENQLQADPRVESPAWLAALPVFLQAFFEDGEGEVNLQGNRLTVKGNRPASRGRASLAAVFEPMRKVGCEVSDQVRLVPDLEPTFQASLNDSSLQLKGRLPGASIRDRIVEAAKSTGATLDNKLELNSAVQDSAWLQAVPDLVRQFFTDRKTGELIMNTSSWRIRGDVETEAARAALLAALSQAIPKSKTLNSEGLVLAATMAPAPTMPVVPVPVPQPVGPVHIRLKGGRLEVAGNVATPQRKAALEKELGVLKPAVFDASKLVVTAGGADPVWADGVVPVAKSFFQGAPEAELEWQIDSLRLQREFRSTEEKNQILASVKKVLPADVKLIDQTSVLALKAVPLAMPAPAKSVAPWLLVQFGASEHRMEGQVRTESERRVLRDAVASRAAEVKVVESGLKVAGETDAAVWAVPVSRFLPKFGALVRNGRLEVRDGKLTLSGEALNPRTRDSLLAELSGSLPNDGLKVEDKMVVRESDSDGAASPAFVVYFNPNSDWIRPDGRLEIDNAAALIATLAPGTTVLVKGFADSRGDALGNLRLSELRAAAVRDSLVYRGVRVEQLELIGVGEEEARKGRSEEVWSKDRRVEIIAVRK